MKNDDVELIQRVLAGDENAFSTLVRKYQKPVHALVWRLRCVNILLKVWVGRRKNGRLEGRFVPNAYL